MPYAFPDDIARLPRADIPLAGCTAYLSQAADHQVIFMTFAQDVDLPPHAHATQWAAVLAGQIDLTIGGVLHTFRQGDSYRIPAGEVHSGHIYAGYADVTYFNQPDRYRAVEQA